VLMIELRDDEGGFWVVACNEVFVLMGRFGNHGSTIIAMCRF
jgi:hypothetical protein